jgi:hypothetical protein
VLLLGGVAGIAFHWAASSHHDISTAWWPFYLDPSPPFVVWTPRILLSLGALVLAALAVRRWIRGSGGKLDLALLLGAVYLLHFALGVQRHGVEPGLTHTFARNGLEYWGDRWNVWDDPGQFLRKFPTFRNPLTQHGATHPPGLTLLLAGLWSLGLKNLWVALVCSFFAVLSALPLYGAARRLTDEPTARLVVPAALLACSVSAFAVLSMDIVIMFLAALALYGLARALDGERAGGALLGLAFALATFCTFAAFTLVLTFGGVLLARVTDPTRPLPSRAWQALAIGVAVFLAFYALLVLGFGYRSLLVFQMSADAFRKSPDFGRPRLASALSSPLAFLGALGLPLAGLSAHAIGGAFARLRRRLDRPTVALVLGAFAPAAFCIAAGRPRGEVEHVFLLFVPAVVLASLTAARRWYGRGARWLELAVILLMLQSIAIETLVETYW